MRRTDFFYCGRFIMIKWKDDFSCNIAEIDHQHKKLFEIGGRIYYAASINDGYDHYDEIMGIVHELVEYTVYHFKYEEDLLLKHGYSEFEAHKIEHDFFIKKVRKIAGKDFESSQYDTILELVNFVSNWIAEHILKSDFAYKSFLNTKGIY